MLADKSAIGFYTPISYYRADVILFSFLLLTSTSVFQLGCGSGPDIIKSRHSRKPCSLAATIMKLSIAISFLLFLNSFCFGQTTKEQKFKATIQEIITAFSKQYSIKVSKFINPTIGLYQLDRVGVFDYYNHFKTVSFSDATYPQVLFQSSKGVKNLPLKYASLPTWDCDKEVWSKKGLFVDTTKLIIFFPKFVRTEISIDLTTYLRKKYNFFIPWKQKAGG
jgi:hypothetical protein